MEIRKSWLWLDTGFWTVKVDYDVEVGVKGSIVRNGGADSAMGHFDVSSPVLFVANMEAGVRNGLGDVTSNLEPKLKNAK